MNRFTKKAAIILALVSVSVAVFADRGTGKKSKVRTNLNISTTSSLKTSILSNVKSGLTYKGSLLSTRKISSNSVLTSSITTYQKGNTTYIVPFKNKVTVPDMKQGYTGVKLIIRSNH